MFWHGFICLEWLSKMIPTKIRNSLSILEWFYFLEWLAKMIKKNKEFLIFKCICLIFIDFICFSKDFHWFPLVFIDYHWFPLVFHYFLLISKDFYWFSSFSLILNTYIYVYIYIYISIHLYIYSCTILKDNVLSYLSKAMPGVSRSLPVPS